MKAIWVFIPIFMAIAIVLWWRIGPVEDVVKVKFFLKKHSWSVCLVLISWFLLLLVLSNCSIKLL